MKIWLTHIMYFVSGVCLMSCSEADKKNEKEMESNPLLLKWEASYGGVLPFDKVRLEHFEPAIEKAIQLREEEILAIANNPHKATFENTIVALDTTGEALSQVLAVYHVWSSNISSPEFEKIETRVEPKLAAHNDKIYQNEALFKRVETVYFDENTKKLSDEAQRLVWKYYQSFVLNGSRLDTKSKEKLSAINQELAGLYTKFSQNQLADENEKYIVVNNRDELAGMPEEWINAAAEAAAQRKLSNAWVVSNTRSVVDPLLTYAHNRALREKVWRMFTNRGDNGDDNDNNKLIPKILRLRQERAKLLGFETHAHWRLSNTMAKTPDNAMNLMLKVWEPAKKLVSKEVSEMQQIADKEKNNIKIEPWDYKYYAEKVRKAKYDLDQNEIKPYMQLEKLREGMFWVAGQIFGLAFEEVYNLPVFHPDVRVWKVTDLKSNKIIGLWYFDPYARAGKRSGAWMTEYRMQSNINGQYKSALVSNNSNFIKPKPGDPVLLSWDDAETLFHEFGHALHGLCSDVTYPSLAGTSVPQDYVEFPSQIFERWLSTPEVLQKFAIHYQTGESLPLKLIDKINKAAKFNQGFFTVEALAAAIVDMKLHLTTGDSINPDQFEKTALAEIGMPREIVMRHRLPHFGHIFSSDEYSAGYYSYLWSDVISADAFEAFLENKGPYDVTVAERLKKYVFSAGNSMEPELAYVKFRGKQPSPLALMKNRGL